MTYFLLAPYSLPYQALIHSYIQRTAQAHHAQVWSGFGFTVPVLYDGGDESRKPGQGAENVEDIEDESKAGCKFSLGFLAR